MYHLYSYRWGQGTQLKHGGFYSGPDKFNPGHLIEHKFEDATIVDKKSWGNRRNIRLEDIKGIHELISELVSIISCNGRMADMKASNGKGGNVHQEGKVESQYILSPNGDAANQAALATHV